MTREVEKLFSMLIQRYDVLSGWIKNRFVGILSVELDGIWNHQWNAERVIVFQTVILQIVSGVYGLRNIRDQIDSRLDLCNKGTCNELVQDSHRAEEEYLGNKCGTSNPGAIVTVIFQTLF